MMTDEEREDVERAIESRHPGIMRPGAERTMAEMAEYLRLEHPELGVETEADLIIGLMTQPPSEGGEA